MRRIILFLFLVTYIYAYSQNQDSINNFHTENNQVVWKKVFKTSLGFEQLLSRVKDSGLFKDVENEQTKMRCDLKYIDTELFEYGVKNTNTAVFLINHFIEGFVIIDFKPGRYRVTLKKILLTEKNVDSLNIVGTSSFIEGEIFKYGKVEFNYQFKNHSSVMLNKMFTQYFDFNQIICDDNW